MIHQKFAKTVKLFSRVTFVVSQYLSTNLSLFPFCPTEILTVYILKNLPYTYKFSRDVVFADD